MISNVSSDTISLLKLLETKGVSVSLDGNDIICRPKPEKALYPEIAKHKANIIACLLKKISFPPPVFKSDPSNSILPEKLTASAINCYGEVLKSASALTEHQVTQALLALQNHGIRPEFFVHPVMCRKCGAVWERDWTYDKVESCAWCSRRFKGEIPRPTAEDFRAWQMKKNVEPDDKLNKRVAIQDGGIPRPLAAEQNTRESSGCGACGGKRFWVSIYGQIVCYGCRKPPQPELVARVIECTSSAVVDESETII